MHIVSGHADAAARAAVEGHTFGHANATVDLMADVMRERVAQAGACTLDDLAAAGFTAAEVAEYAGIARARAAKAWTRRVSRPASARRFTAVVL